MISNSASTVLAIKKDLRLEEVLEEFRDSGLPRLLFITHGWGGGVEQHVQDLLMMLKGKACVMILRGRSHGRVEIELAGSTLRLARWEIEGFEDHYQDWLASLSAMGFARLHLHHVHGWSPGILRLIQDLALPLDITLHDYFCISPRYHLSPLAESADVFEAMPHPADGWPLELSEWRALFEPVLASAERLIAPTHDVAQRICSVHPRVQPLIEPHPEPALAFPRLIKIALLGGMSPAKGLHLVKRVASMVKAKGLGMSFRLIGHSAEPLPENISATGLYPRERLGYLIELERPDVIWFASQVHETFSFTLSAALASGRPIVASAVGSFVDRLADVDRASLLPPDAPPRQWIEAFENAVPKVQCEDPAYQPRSLDDYAGFYLEPLHTYDEEPSKTVLFESLMLNSPAATPDPEIPIKLLFQIGVRGGHTPSLDLVERRLDALPDAEVEVSPRSEFDRLHAELVGMRGALGECQERVQERKESCDRKQTDFDMSQRELAEASDALSEALVQVERLESERSVARDELMHALVQVERLEAERNFARDDLGRALAQVEHLEGERNAARDDLMHALVQVERLKHDFSSQETAFGQCRDALQEADRRDERARRQLAVLERERDEARAKVQEFVGSTSWKVTRPLRLVSRLLRNGPKVLARLAGFMIRPSGWARLLKMLKRSGLRGVAERLRQEIHIVSAPPAVQRKDVVEQRLLQQSAARRDPEMAPLILSTSEQPELSIVIPVHGQHRTTYDCLASIAANPPSVPYEVIIADDASPEPVKDALGMVSGMRVVRHDKNLGFLGNSNAGARSARGSWLLLLNNDTLVCQGALDALLNTFVEHERVGLVGAKLLNRDGSIQEAGGIIWRDGSGWNWGRNQHREDPRFNFVRDADYCSGAVLVIDRKLFLDMGGFDTRYAPAYYEDTDLAFRIRERGLRVLYQPAAEVYHLEGVSHGTDTGSGIKAYQEVNARKFFERWKSTLEKHRENADMPELEAHRESRGNILIVEACMITPDQDSGSVRMLNLLAILKREGYHVSFVADNLENRAPYVGQLRQMGIEVYHGGEWTGGGVRQLIKRLGPQLDVIMFCRHYIAVQYIDEVRALAPRARIIFDTVDLHFLREEREARLHANSAMLRAAAVTRKQELGVIAASDVTLVVSDVEKNLLADIMPKARVEIVSNIHSREPARPGYADREGILFVGGFRHPPNVDAMTWYAHEILPHVRRLLPGVKTRVIGSNMPASVRDLAQADFEILGFIENIEPYLTTARVSIAPLRYGAGVKGKVNEAMNYGIPVVATSCAVEGMHVQPEQDVLSAEDAQDFAAAIARVYRDQALWERLSKAGVQSVHRHFSAEAALPAIRRMLEGVGR